MLTGIEILMKIISSIYVIEQKQPYAIVLQGLRNVTALLIQRIVYTSLNLARGCPCEEREGGTRGIRGRHDVYCRPQLYVCVWLFYDSGGWTWRFVGDARPWQPSRESCHVESSPGDMTTAFYDQRVMSSSLAAAVDPEIEIKYLPIATMSRSFIPYNAEQHSNGDF